MKTSVRIALTYVAALFAGNVSAGEGGVAGSAAFDIDVTTSTVNYATMAGAVGKDTAYAGSNASGGATAVLDSFAVGTGGIVTLGTGNYVGNIAEDSARVTGQGNELGAGVFVDFDAKAGTADISNQ
jgi:hypothetical protein